MTSTPRQTARHALVLLSAPLLLSACAVASGITPQERAIQQQVAVDQYMPATRDMRDNIETQELFAQAAFWSNEYELNPADLEATIKLAAAVRRLGNPGRAVEITQTSRQIHPRDPYLLAEHAAGLIASERALDALPILDQGLRLAPGYGRLWSLKGAALDQMEEYDAARQNYDRALRITPNDPNVLANLGLSHALSGDPETAEVWLRRAAAQPGAGAGVRQNLALVLQLQGRTDAAAQQTRLSKLSRGDRKLPPEPVPAFTPRGTPAQLQPQETVYAPGIAPDRASAIAPGSRAAAAPSPGSFAQGQPLSPPSRPRTAAAQTSAPPLQGAVPQARLRTHAPDGQAFTSASQAARAVGGTHVPVPRSAPEPAPFAHDGSMSPEQIAVLNNIRRSLQPGTVGPQTDQPSVGPHVVGRVPQPIQGGYPTQPAFQPAVQSPSGPDRRQPLRRRR